MICTYFVVFYLWLLHFQLLFMWFAMTSWKWNAFRDAGSWSENLCHSCDVIIMTFTPMPVVIQWIYFYSRRLHLWILGNRMLVHIANEIALVTRIKLVVYTVYPRKYAHGFCFAVLCCGYTLTYFPISIRLTSLALWQSNDCPSASKATLMNMDKYFMWVHYERLHNHNKAKHNKTVCIFLGINYNCNKS